LYLLGVALEASVFVFEEKFGRHSLEVKHTSKKLNLTDYNEWSFRNPHKREQSVGKVINIR
jgi:hypothetical protein